MEDFRNRLFAFAEPLADHKQGILLFLRFASPEFGYTEWQRMIVPIDSKKQS